MQLTTLGPSKFGGAFLEVPWIFPRLPHSLQEYSPPRQVRLPCSTAPLEFWRLTTPVPAVSPAALLARQPSHHHSVLPVHEGDDRRVFTVEPCTFNAVAYRAAILSSTLLFGHWKKHQDTFVVLHEMEGPEVLVSALGQDTYVSSP